MGLDGIRWDGWDRMEWDMMRWDGIACDKKV